MDPTRQGSPFQPIEPSPASSSSQTAKIPLEPKRMQIIKDAFENYKKNANDLNAWWTYKFTVSDQIDQTALKAVCQRIGIPALENGDALINLLYERKMIPEEDVGGLNTFIVNNFREKEPDETVEPNLIDKQGKAQRREAITAAYQEYMAVDPANRAAKDAAYRTFVDKVNQHMTEQEVKSIALAYGAKADISDFKGLTSWLEGQADSLSEEKPARAILDGKDPSTVKKIIDRIVPSNKL